MDKLKLAPAAALPPGIVKADLEHKVPYGATDKAYTKWREANELVAPRSLELYYTERFGWVITTLLISNGSRRTRSYASDYGSRSYGITLKGDPVRVGMGPHVKQRITVHLRKSRLKDLQQYIDLYNRGLEVANEARDVRSSRQLRGSLRRQMFNGF